MVPQHRRRQREPQKNSRSSPPPRLPVNSRSREVARIRYGSFCDSGCSLAAQDVWNRWGPRRGGPGCGSCHLLPGIASKPVPPSGSRSPVRRVSPVARLPLSAPLLTHRQDSPQALDRSPSAKPAAPQSSNRAKLAARFMRQFAGGCASGVAQGRGPSSTPRRAGRHPNRARRRLPTPRRFGPPPLAMSRARMPRYLEG
jgi:hypothetical protein